MPAKILIVDDQPENLLALSALLQAPDRELLLAKSGTEALRMVLQEEELALILLDVHMPDMEGDEVARAILARDRSRHVPIIMLTASAATSTTLERSYKAGAVDHLDKPIKPLILETKVRVFAELFEQRKKVAQQAEQLRAQERLERARELARVRQSGERQLQGIANALPAIVWTMDAQGEVTWFNDTWYAYTGFSREGRRPLTEAVDAQDEAAARAQFAAAGERGDPFEFRARLRRHDGAYRWHLCRNAPLQDDQAVTGWFGTAVDIDELIKAREEAEGAVRIRDEFLSIAAHELRTPLTSMALSVDSLARSAPGAEAKAGKVKKQIRRLNQLVEALLDVSRLAEGRLSLRPEPTDLTRVVSEVAQRFREELNGAAARVEARLEPQVQGTWDPLRIEQVFTNLLANALKYGDGKPVEISLQRREGVAVVEVRDHGIGIQREHLDRIFGKFERAVAATSYGGLGLGLYISRQLVEAHGGRLTADSEPGRGSTFRVELPLSPPRATSEA